MVEAEKTASSGEQDRIWRARDVMHALQKLLKTAKMFSPTHPQYDLVYQDFRDRLVSFHEVFGAMKFQVNSSSFSIENQPIYDEERGLPFRFFLSGIRELALSPGIEEEELRELIAIAHQDKQQGDDDLVTLLWKKNLPHVSYFALDELYESWGQEEEDLLDESERENLKRMKQGVEEVVQALSSRNAALSLGGGMRYTVSDDGQELQALTEELPPEEEAAGESGPAGEALAWPTLDQRELETIKAELPSLLGQALVDRAVGIALDIIRLAGEKIHGEGFFTFLNLCLMRAMEEGDLPTLNRLVARLGDLAQACAQGQELEKSLRDNLAGEEMIAEFLRVINGRYLGGKGEVQRYLAILPPAAVKPLCASYPEIERREERQVIRDFLVTNAAADPLAIRRLIEHADPGVRKDGIYILGRMEGPVIVDLVPGVLKQEDTATREYGMLVLSRVNVKEKAPLLLEALRDHDERIRIMAARQLAEVGETSLVSLLRDIVLAEDFPNRSAAEQEAFVLSLGRLGGSLAVPFLEELAGRRSFFHRKKLRELRRLAQQALKEIEDGQGS